jgi:hypothetical protein
MSRVYIALIINQLQRCLKMLRLEALILSFLVRMVSKPVVGLGYICGSSDIVLLSPIGCSSSLLVSNILCV